MRIRVETEAVECCGRRNMDALSLRTAAALTMRMIRLSPSAPPSCPSCTWSSGDHSERDHREQDESVASATVNSGRWGRGRSSGRARNGEEQDDRRADEIGREGRIRREPEARVFDGRRKVRSFRQQVSRNQGRQQEAATGGGAGKIRPRNHSITRETQKCSPVPDLAQVPQLLRSGLWIVKQVTDPGGEPTAPRRR